MDKLVVFYAPNQADFFRTLKKIKRYKSSEIVPVYIELFERVEKSFQSEGLGDDCEQQSIIANVKETLWKLIFEEGYRISKGDNALWQAYLWALLTINCAMEKKRARVKDDSDRIFYAGCSFGEYWAITYAMYISGRMSAYDAILLAYYRGEEMMKIVSESSCSYAKIVLPGSMDAYEDEISSFERERRLILGRLVLEDGTLCLFGPNPPLMYLAKTLGVKEITSIPFHSYYLFSAGKRFVERFIQKGMNLEGLCENVITDRTNNYLPEIVAQEFYTSLDERKVLRSIEEKIASIEATEYSLIRL